MNWFGKLLLAAVIATAPLLALSPIGNPNAPKGGTFTVAMPSFPKSLMIYLANEETAMAVGGMVFETLIEMHPDTFEAVPLLAEKWEVTKDQLTFTFHLNAKAKFSDGKPVTAEDVKFTWDTIYNKKNKTAPFQSYFASFSGCEVVNPTTVKFSSKTKHFKNLEKFSSFAVLAKHFFSKGDFNKAYNTNIFGSGPYTLEKFQHGEKINLKRNPDYWGAALPLNLGRYNFDRVAFRTIPDHNVAFELFKKGEVDYFYFLISKTWATEAVGGPFEKNYIVKLKTENKLPFGTQGIAWNLRRPLFSDARVRRALAHLFNFEKVNREILYNNYRPATGVLATTSDYHSPKLKPIPYDPKAARRLFEEAGWKPGAGGVLEKDGQKFAFELVTDNPVYLRWLTLYQEELKAMGVAMSLRVADWATRLKLMDDWQFDAVDSARGRDIDPSDFTSGWGSKEAEIKGSSNFMGYKNAKLDELATKIDLEFDKAKRIPLVREIEEMISNDQPMLFTTEAMFTRLGYWNRFSFPGKGYFNYSNWRDAYQYWWLDKAKDEKLRAAMAKGEPIS